MVQRRRTLGDHSPQECLLRVSLPHRPSVHAQFDIRTQPGPRCNHEQAVKMKLTAEQATVACGCPQSQAAGQIVRTLADQRDIELQVRTHRPPAELHHGIPGVPEALGDSASLLGRILEQDGRVRCLRVRCWLLVPELPPNLFVAPRVLKVRMQELVHWGVPDFPKRVPERDVTAGVGMLCLLDIAVSTGDLSNWTNTSHGSIGSIACVLTVRQPLCSHTQPVRKGTTHQQATADCWCTYRTLSCSLSISAVLFTTSPMSDCWMDRMHVCEIGVT